MVRARAAYIDYLDDAVEDGKLSAKFKKLATEGIELDLQIKALKKRQDEIKNLIKDEFGEETKLSLVVPGVGTVPLVPKEEVIVADANRLKVILAADFDNHVKTSVTFKALPPLVELVYDDKRPTHDLVTETVTFKQSCSLSFKAEKR